MTLSLLLPSKLFSELIVVSAWGYSVTFSTCLNKCSLAPHAYGDSHHGNECMMADNTFWSVSLKSSATSMMALCDPTGIPIPESV